MRPNADAERIRELASELAKVASQDVTVYLTGGATAVLHGWRDSTVDIDLRLEPDSDELLRRIAAVKNELHVNVELASPPDFIPELPGWRERSPFAFSEGQVTVRHFDPYSQALSKVWRDFELDRADVRAMIDGGLVEPGRLEELFAEIEPALFRYPSLDPDEFRAKLARTLGR